MKFSYDGSLKIFDEKLLSDFGHVIQRISGIAESPTMY